MANYNTTGCLRILLIMTLLYAANTTIYAADPDCEQVLKQMVERYGGATELSKLNKVYRQHWDLIALPRNEKGTDTRTINLPQHLTIELTYPSNSEKRILDGDIGRKVYNKSRHIQAHGPGLMAMKLQRMRLYNPLFLLHRAAEIDAEEDGDMYYRLTLRESGLTTDYYVNRQTFLIDKVIGTLMMNGGVMTFLTEYDDYKSVDGIMMPHKEVKYAGNVNTAVLTLRTTQFGS